MPEARVLIVSKTKMRNDACVGGITENGKSVRLLTRAKQNQPRNTPFNIGDSWTINYDVRDDLIPPHVEDIFISSKTKNQSGISVPDSLAKLHINP